jgi:NitT/TauT family transport system permease protein
VRNCYFSFLEFFYGFLLAIVIGVPFGFLMATQDKLNNFLDPWVSCVYATPRVALAPIVVVWFGLGIFPSSLIVFLGAVFPILLNTYTGIKSVRQNLVDVVRAFGGSSWQIFFKVMIPDATPAIIAGMRLAVGRAVIGVVVAELFGAEAGLGFMVYLYSQRFLPGPVFVGIVVLVVFGIAAFIALEKLQRWVSPWYAYQLQQRVQGMEME